MAAGDELAAAAADDDGDVDDDEEKRYVEVDQTVGLFLPAAAEKWPAAAVGEDVVVTDAMN